MFRPALILILISCLFEIPHGRIIKRNNDDERRVFSTCFEDIGCVDFNEKWYDEKYRPRNLDPLDRHTIRTEFLLMKNPKNESTELVYDVMSLKKETVEVAGFRKGTCTIFIIHDFTSNGYTGWIKHIVVALSRKTDCNVISIDWQAGAEPPLEQALSNARVVALEAKMFITMLKECFNQSPETLHVIGHGVGSHIAGYIGKSICGLQRITALDPTGPFFAHMPKEVRLDADDARYVEVLHTDHFNHRSQGSKFPFGHANFLINDALHQPGCNDSSHMPSFVDLRRDSLQEGKILPACSHKRSFKYYIQALEECECKFIGIHCVDYESFLMGQCNSCPGNGTCATFGLEPPSVKTKNNNYYILTNEHTPFCMISYTVNITLEGGEVSKDVEGYFEMILIDDNSKVTNATNTLSGAMRKMTTGHFYKFVFYASLPPINKVKEAKVRWNYNSNKICILCDKSITIKDISIKRIAIKPDPAIKMSLICPIHDKMELKNGDYMQFVACESLYGPEYATNGHKAVLKPGAAMAGRKPYILHQNILKNLSSNALEHCDNSSPSNGTQMKPLEVSMSTSAFTSVTPRMVSAGSEGAVTLNPSAALKLGDTFADKDTKDFAECGDSLRLMSTTPKCVIRKKDVQGMRKSRNV